MKALRNIFYAHGFGKVAPWVDLANSEEWDGFGKRTDHLTDPEWLAAFQKHWKLAPILRGKSSRLRLQNLRELLLSAAQKLAAGHAPNAAEISKLNHALNVPVRQRLVQHQNGWRAQLVPVNRDTNWALAQIAASLTETLAGQQAKRVRICANTDCRWVFHDPTKGGTKRWCNDRTCGNRARVRRARAARK
ncbi:MAG TPA: CGNR zinc finger domain-containing protein [Candidatus Polarisedimenticolia bacterium]|nr:CGNR zinc finger domain-containing protein [Candidatus Polarisedimenticolia bacterium]